MQSPASPPMVLLKKDMGLNDDLMMATLNSPLDSDSASELSMGEVEPPRRKSWFKRG